MLNLTKDNWKGAIWVGTAFFIEDSLFECLFLIMKGFSSDRFFRTGIQMTLDIFFITLGVLKYKGAPRFVTVTLTIAIPLAFLFLCLLISYYLR